MAFAKVYFFSALLGGVVGSVLTIYMMLTLKILEAKQRAETRVEADGRDEIRERPIAIGVQESAQPEQEHDERSC